MAARAPKLLAALLENGTLLPLPPPPPPCPPSSHPYASPGTRREKSPPRKDGKKLSSRTYDELLVRHLLKEPDTLSSLLLGTVLPSPDRWYLLEKDMVEFVLDIVAKKVS